MQLCIVILICTAVYGISRISEDDLIAVNFAKPMAGQKLNESVIKEIEVESEGSCRLECVEEERCWSYNFGTTKNNAEKFKCELSDSDRFTGFKNVTKEENFTYVGLQVIFYRMLTSTHFLLNTLHCHNDNIKAIS